MTISYDWLLQRVFVENSLPTRPPQHICSSGATGVTSNEKSIYPVRFHHRTAPFDVSGYNGADYSCSASPSMNCSHDSGDFIAVNNKALTGCPDNNGKTPHACPSPSFWRAVQACARFRSYAKIRRRRETEFVAHSLRSWDAYSEFVPVGDCGAKPLIAFWYQDRYS